MDVHRAPTGLDLDLQDFGALYAGDLLRVGPQLAQLPAGLRRGASCCTTLTRASIELACSVLS